MLRVRASVRLCLYIVCKFITLPKMVSVCSWSFWLSRTFLPPRAFFFFASGVVVLSLFHKVPRNRLDFGSLSQMFYFCCCSTIPSPLPHEHFIDLSFVPICLYRFKPTAGALPEKPLQVVASADEPWVQTAPPKPDTSLLDLSVDGETAVIEDREAVHFLWYEASVPPSKKLVWEV